MSDSSDQLPDSTTGRIIKNNLTVEAQSANQRGPAPVLQDQELSRQQCSQTKQLKYYYKISKGKRKRHKKNLEKASASKNSQANSLFITTVKTQKLHLHKRTLSLKFH